MNVVQPLMRLPEGKIKEAIVHPETIVREEALLYFTGCYSPDAEVMPLAIKAIETYGRGHAFQYVNVLAHLKQTEATVDWAIKELHQKAGHETYLAGLSQLLGSADPQLLASRAGEILQAPGFFKTLRDEFQERLRLATWDADQCWKELERICTAAVGEKHPTGHFGHASRVVEALARNGDVYVDRILELLGKTVEDFDTDPMVWLEIFLVMLAGEMRLKPAIPLVVKKLHLCGEILSEQCVEALGKIGTDVAAEAVAEGWLEAEWDYRIYASSALEKIHSDATVRACLATLPHDKDLTVRTSLADALLGQFAVEGIEPVRKMVAAGDYEPMNSDLKCRLVAVSTILGVTFPGYPIWKQAAEERRTAQERRMAALSVPLQAPPPEPTEFPAKKPVPHVRTEKKASRNDPCPCGSGKKFKKCCMKRGEGGSF